jgi:hypothetical protein
MGIRDLDGKPIMQFITDIGRQPGPDASGWVFYLWEEGVQLSPSWKSAYIRKVTMPDGKIILLGSGLYEIKVERAFVQTAVDRAVALITGAGTDAAFREFQDPGSQFYFLDTYIFVLDEAGHTLVDPSFPNLAGRNLSGFTDAVGLRPVAEVLQKLKSGDEAWVQYLWRRPGEAVPSRKLIYARRVNLAGRTLIVGSDYYLATPIWMRVEDDRRWPNARPG